MKIVSSGEGSLNHHETPPNIFSLSLNRRFDIKIEGRHFQLECLLSSIQIIHRLELKIMMTMIMMVDVYQVWPLGRTNDLMSPSPRARRLITRKVTTTVMTTSPISPRTIPTIVQMWVALPGFDCDVGLGVGRNG
jgi:hypothetical protein